MIVGFGDTLKLNPGEYVTNMKDGKGIPFRPLADIERPVKISRSLIRYAVACLKQQRKAVTQSHTFCQLLGVITV